MCVTIGDILQRDNGVRFAGQAGLLFHNNKMVEKFAVLAMEKQINNHSLLKMKMKSDGDTDIAVKAQVCQGMEVTVCAGLHLDEHTQAFTARKIEEYAKDDDVEPKYIAL